MKELKMEIPIPKGHEIDVDNSDLTKGIVKFKKIVNKRAYKWKDFKNISGYYIENNVICNYRGIPQKINKEIYPTEEEARAALALCQLLRYRDNWNEGWKPDWNDNDVPKWCVVNRANSVEIQHYYNISRPLSFKNEFTVGMFLEHFKDLIETAKPLL